MINYKSALYSLEKFYKMIRLILNDKKSAYQLHIYTAYKPIYFVVLCKYEKGLAVFIDVVTIAKADYDANKKQIADLDCYLITD